MNRESEEYRGFLRILKEELVPAMGCTEPIAIAYAAAKARDILEDMPEKVVVQASGSIIKNVKSVVVPHTGGKRGIPTAVAAGLLYGDAAKELEVLSAQRELDERKLSDFIANLPVTVEYLDEGHVFDLRVAVYKGSRQAAVRIADHHTKIVQMEKDGEMLYNAWERADRSDTVSDSSEGTGCSEKDLLSMKRIWDFTRNVALDDVKEMLDRQIDCNMAIAREGLAGNYGANIGSVLLASEEDSLRTRAKAMAAAGSDARMNGCELPVVINSGSGNQGITCCVPVVVYGQALGADQEQIYRALVLSNLVAVYEKSGIGTLSAYCGAVSAGAAAGAGIAYLHGGGYDVIKHTIVNALAIVSGIICDGAKASCAAKIASAVDAGILGFEMYRQGQQFYSGDGIVSNGIDATISNVGILGRDGMTETNETIIKMMLEI